MYDATTRGLAVEIGLARLTESNLAVLERKKGVIFADTNVLACEDLGAALAHDNVASLDLFTRVALHAQVLWV